MIYVYLGMCTLNIIFGAYIEYQRGKAISLSKNN